MQILINKRLLALYKIDQLFFLLRNSQMATGDVKLLGARASPFVNRVQFALNIKSIDYEFILECLPDKSELLLKSNPVHKKVPVLIHSDKPISESLAILEYIDEVWSACPSILPSDPNDRAIARFWAAYIDKWFPLVIELRKAQDEESKIALQEKINEGLELLEDAFLKCSKGKAFFGGDTIGYLDIVLGCFLGWLKVSEMTGLVKIFDETKIPGLVGWAERFSSNKATQGVTPEPEELIGFLKMFQAKGIIYVLCLGISLVNLVYHLCRQKSIMKSWQLSSWSAIIFDWLLGFVTVLVVGIDQLDKPVEKLNRD